MEIIQIYDYFSSSNSWCIIERQFNHVTHIHGCLHLETSLNICTVEINNKQKYSADQTQHWYKCIYDSRGREVELKFSVLNIFKKFVIIDFVIFELVTCIQSYVTSEAVMLTAIIFVYIIAYTAFVTSVLYPTNVFSWCGILHFLFSALSW